MADGSQNQPDTAEPSDERKTELEAAYEQQKETDEPYKDIEIRSLGELYWIIARRGWSNGYQFSPDHQWVDVIPSELPVANLSRANLDGANLSGANLSGMNLSGATLVGTNLSDAFLMHIDLSATNLLGTNLSNANLQKSNLSGASLEDACLDGATLSRADFSGARFEKMNLIAANLENANLRAVCLEGINLSNANLISVNLSGANLIGANLSGANLSHTDLSSANLERSSLSGTNLIHANMRSVKLSRANLSDAKLQMVAFDSLTNLTDIILSDRTLFLADVVWGGASLISVDWDPVHLLGDEVKARRPTDDVVGMPKSKEMRRDEWKAAVRAYRLLAVALRTQGMNEEADRFAFRAQLCQRHVALWQARSKKSGRWPARLRKTLQSLSRAFWSGFLDLIAGYGYHPWRSLFWYLATIASFTFMYMQATHGWIPLGLPAPSSLPQLPWYEALILSVSSFHGRGFFQPLQSLGDPVAALAAIEAVIGLFIEITFIATFTQRFFGR